jgi:hypothetical protein
MGVKCEQESVTTNNLAMLLFTIGAHGTQHISEATVAFNLASALGRMTTLSIYFWSVGAGASSWSGEDQYQSWTVGAYSARCDANPLCPPAGDASRSPVRSIPPELQLSVA